MYQTVPEDKCKEQVLHIRAPTVKVKVFFMAHTHEHTQSICRFYTLAKVQTLWEALSLVLASDLSTTPHSI